jgi:hypothetical protein
MIYFVGDPAIAATPISEDKFRDTISLPASSIRGVIFGKDCLASDCAHIINILKRSEFGHVRTWQTEIHSLDFSIQYLEKTGDDILLTASDHTRAISSAKDHDTALRKCEYKSTPSL